MESSIQSATDRNDFRDWMPYRIEGRCAELEKDLFHAIEHPLKMASIAACRIFSDELREAARIAEAQKVRNAVKGYLTPVRLLTEFGISLGVLTVLCLVCQGVLALSHHWDYLQTLKINAPGLTIFTTVVSLCILRYYYVAESRDITAANKITVPDSEKFLESLAGRPVTYHLAGAPALQKYERPEAGIRYTGNLAAQDMWNSIGFHRPSLTGLALTGAAFVAVKLWDGIFGKSLDEMKSELSCELSKHIDRLIYHCQRLPEDFSRQQLDQLIEHARVTRSDIVSRIKTADKENQIVFEPPV